MAAVRRHTRVVNGRKQTVKAHRRQLQPGRARANLRRAGRHRRRRQYGPAVACAAVAAAEIGGWLALRGAGIALVTIGIAALGVGVAARRATPSTPKPTHRSPGTVRTIPPGARPARQPKQASMGRLERIEFERDGSITTHRTDGTKGRIATRDQRDPRYRGDG